MNKCFFTGNLTRDPELRTLDDGTKVVNFGLAVNRPYKKGTERLNETAFLDLEAWAQGAETIAKYFSKGEPITVAASVKMDTWEDKTTGQKRSKLKFRVDEFWFIQKYQYKNSNKDEQPVDNNDDGKKDIPF